MSRTIPRYIVYVYHVVLSALLLFGAAPLSATAQGQQPKIDLNTTMSIKLDNTSVESVLNAIAKKSGITFAYNVQDIKELPPVSGEFNNVTIETIISKCLENTTYKFSFEQNTITITRNAPAQKRITIYGQVTDKARMPLAGATIAVKGSSIGISADGGGHYRLSFPDKGRVTVVVSFIGYESKEFFVTQTMNNLNIMLDDAKTNIQDIVVNGVFTRNKSTFTGSVTTIKGEDLLAVSSTNLLSAITALTPGMIQVQNNTMGSNPNAIPELLIRGANSIATSAEQKAYNNPLIILDGMEITMEELYDLDMFEVERVDVLKDAQATIVYGDRAANGVIVIERQQVKDSKVRLSYNFVPEISIPDLSSMNLCNSTQKLELERIAGLYTTNNGALDQAYAYKLQNIRRGVNTDWISVPLRTPFSQTHSLQLSGRGQKIDYRASLRFADKYGVMKGDNRRNYTLNFSVGYHERDKLTLRYSANYSMVDAVESPYGKFSAYTKLNPYEPVFDANGDYVKGYYFDPYNKSTADGDYQVNPLYNATLSSFGKTRAHTLRNTFDAKWYLTERFYLSGQFNVDIRANQLDRYTSPDDAQYKDVTTPDLRGLYQLGRGDGFGYDGKIVANYSKELDSRGSGFTLSAGADIASSRSTSTIMYAQGFLKDNLSDIKYALAYPTDPKYKPDGMEAINARVGVFASGNLYYRNRYFADVSYRTTGASEYGANNRFAPMWSFGLGWNLHKEQFMEKIEWMNLLRLTWTWGYAGQSASNPYQAMTTYRYDKGHMYYTGVGAVPIRMGNPNLKWQRTRKNNIGIDASFLGERIIFSLDYFSNVTTDQLMSIPLPASVGSQDITVNFGENQNVGFDYSLSGRIISNNNWSWTMAINGTHVKDRINKISDILRNTSYDVDPNSSLKLRFREGGSQYDLYAVKSAGIDPATGQEIFINRDGNATFKYDAADEIVVGNTSPTLQGSWLNTIRYKGWSLNFVFSYTVGGDIYNETLKNKVENINPKFNVDARAFTDRWKTPGDLSRYLAIGSAQKYNSERFVERLNELWLSSAALSYEFESKFLKKIGFKRLNVGVGVSDIARFSTVRYERGTDYPYCRAINLTFRPTF